MPTSFLDLPREIRDIIYENVLYSPTGYLTPVLDKTSRSVRFTLRAIRIIEDDPDPHTKLFTVSSKDVLSLSLPRTCRQINEETRGMVWPNNIFAFNDVPTMTQTLKSMGQAPSRLINSIWLAFKHRHFKALGKAFALLTSRARHGSFRRLDLFVSWEEFHILTNWKHCGNGILSARYDDLLQILREGSKGCNFKRTIRVDSVGPNLDGEREMDTVRDLHLAFGGSMIYDGRLEWNNYEHVGRCGGA